MKKVILAIETATPVCSVALGNKSGRILEKRIEGRGVHSERTFTFIHELIERQEISIKNLDAVLFSHGPGSYTGLRIGAAAVKGLLFRLDVPFYTLSTLTSNAIPFLDNKSAVIHSVIDARREHVYYRKIEFSTDNRIVQSEPELAEISRFETMIQPGEIVTGTGWERFTHGQRDRISWFGKEVISAKNLILAWNHPDLKSLFQKQNSDLFEPEYLSMSQLNSSSI
ncbi:MAG: tRNA (adenosine(37)-N6)-threonylcarbamoyltransferase complex dimerization subunit type 1 TsaB [Balneolaceae bacterium]